MFAKRVLSLILAAVIAVSAMVFVSGSADADPRIRHNMNFYSMDDLTEWFDEGQYYVENAYLCGYDDAKLLQTKCEDHEDGSDECSLCAWVTYDASITLAFDNDEMSYSDRWINLVYRNDNPKNHGQAEETSYIAFSYDVKNSLFRLTEGWNNTDEDGQLMTPVYMEIDTLGYAFFEFGISVSRGRIRCFYNDQLIFDYVDADDKYMIGRATTSPFIFRQDGNFIMADNITVTEQGYLYPVDGSPRPVIPRPQNPAPEDPIRYDEYGRPIHTLGKRDIGFALDIHPVTEGDTEITADLLVMLPEDATGFELGSFCLTMGYDKNVMQLADSLDWQINGTTLESDSISENPYLMLWVSINPKHQFKAGVNVAATMTFNLRKPAEECDHYFIGLELEPESGAESMASQDGVYVQTRYSKDQVYVGNGSVTAISDGVDDPDVPNVPNVPGVDYNIHDIGDKALGIALDIRPIAEGDDVVTADLLVILPSDATGYELGSFAVEMSYDRDVMRLVDSLDWNAKGTTGESESIEDQPYIMIWASVNPKEQFKTGINVAATMTFNLRKPAELWGTYNIELMLCDDAGGVASMASKDGTYKQRNYTSDELYISGDVYQVKPAVDGPDIEPDYNPGDADGNGEVNLLDVTRMLQIIANWNIDADRRGADANGDGEVNLMDITLMLQYIAKWDVVLG